MTSERGQVREELSNELERWEELLSGLSEGEITASRLPNVDHLGSLLTWIDKHRG